MWELPSFHHKKDFSKVSTHLFNDEEEVYLVDPEGLDLNIWDYRYDLAVQVIEELL